MSDSSLFGSLDVVESYVCGERGEGLSYTDKLSDNEKWMVKFLANAFIAQCGLVCPVDCPIRQLVKKLGTMALDSDDYFMYD